MNKCQEHAELFFKLRAQWEGGNIHIDASYPVENIAWTPERHLRSAEYNEYEGEQVIYPSFARIAEEEGFMSAAATFQMIAEIEKTHGDRFGQLAKRAEEDALFRSDKEVPWLCLNCGHVHYGTQVPPICPVCKHAQGYFVRVESTEILVLQKK